MLLKTHFLVKILKNFQHTKSGNVFDENKNKKRQNWYIIGFSSKGYGEPRKNRSKKPQILQKAC